MAKLESHPEKTLLTITVGFIILSLALKNPLFLKIGLVVGLIGVFSSYLAKKIEWLWFGLAKVLALIVPNILLGAIFYLFLSPIALLKRLLGKSDTLMLSDKYSSTFHTVNKKFGKEDLENPW